MNLLIIVAAAAMFALVVMAPQLREMGAKAGRLKKPGDWTGGPRPPDAQLQGPSSLGPEYRYFGGAPEPAEIITGDVDDIGAPKYEIGTRFIESPMEARWEVVQRVHTASGWRYQLKGSADSHSETEVLWREEWMLTTMADVGWQVS